MRSSGTEPVASSWSARKRSRFSAAPGSRSCSASRTIASSARFTGGKEDPRRRARLVKGFAHAHPPEKVGEAIVKAIATNRALVPVGFESVLGWYAHRLTPIAFGQSLARLGGRP